MAARSYVSRSWLTGLLYVAPALIFIGVIVLYPFAQLVYMSMFRWNLLEGQGAFRGFGNYVRAWEDEQFWTSLWFTLKYTLVITPILLVLGYLAALLTMGRSRIQNFTRGVIFLPVVIGLGSSSILWFWLFDQQVGLFNKLLMDVGLIDNAPVWFADQNMAMLGVIISVTWKIVGLGMILFVAALQSIPNDITEAGMIDGAGYWRRVWSIMVPLTLPTITLFIIVSAVPSLLAFDQFYIMTQGGPRNQTITSVYWIYTNSFRSFRLGYGAALSVILVAMIFAMASLQILITRWKGRR
ncbi:carbohydrate ABC transporter permease [Qingshengfaniella alkalisoli]|uniref:Sugar ABC transporter permease n=1 Tax=Qingshengfaniella alkalisoli TaxID=2599296 RepID=A0A5B8J9Q3_9RHOB|nr:sugar ABC transporter permease [Qingshengfaniella alkalisoli]QDY71037.1 sugar ABC transporter permease [Qingshengfaniella alkalisoli]